MNYYKRNDTIIEKYNVILDRGKLRELKDNIIKDCSVYKHEEKYHIYNELPMVNYQDIKNRKIINCKSNHISKNIINYSYDVLYYPDLVKIIDKLLNEDANAINEIENYNIEGDYKDFSKCYLKLIQYYNEIFKLVSLRLEGTLQVSDLEKIVDFFGITFEIANSSLYINRGNKTRTLKK